MCKKAKIVESERRMVVTGYEGQAWGLAGWLFKDANL